MDQKEFKKGDRVTVNNHRVEFQGRQGTVKYTSGGLVWVLLDGDTEMTPGFQPWSLDRAAAGARA